MPTSSGAFSRDANHVPFTEYGAIVTKSQTLSGTGTVATALFTLTGTVLVKALYGIVTTDLGANQTAAFWRLNDQTATPAISLATGTTISAAKAGSIISRISLVSVALSFKNASAGAVLDPVAATAPDVFMPFVIVQKTAGVTTNIEFVFTTTDNPTSGVIQHFVGYVPLSSDGNLTAL